MSRYHFDLAQATDDAALRHILAATPTSGAIALGFEREPSYFDAAVVEGQFRQTLALRDRHTGAIVGCGSRSVSLRYVNGMPTPIGYLGNLRIVAEHRRIGLLARGYKFLHTLHQDQRTQLYLTTIAEGNSEALGVLTKNRVGLPSYHFAGRFHTVAIPLGRRLKAPAGNFTIRPAQVDDLPALVEFLDRAGSQRQFFPCYQRQDFVASNGILRDLRLEDILLAFHKGQVIGTLASWDQHVFRQQIVRGYGLALRRMRPVYNAWAGLRGRPGLPPAGTVLRPLIAALPIVAGDDPAVFAALLKMMLWLKSNGTWDYLLLGLHESDPLLPVMRRYRGPRYTTRLYHVCWKDGEDLRRSLDNRPVYLELGSL